jgi:hypothetical protein
VKAGLFTGNKQYFEKEGSFPKAKKIEIKTEEPKKLEAGTTVKKAA